jgi:hypothetical protein
MHQIICKMLVTWIKYWSFFNLSLFKNVFSTFLVFQMLYYLINLVI